MKKQLQEKGRPALSLLLVVVMIAELAVAGFKYPGFLVKTPNEPNGGHVSTEADPVNSAQSTAATDPANPANPANPGQTDPDSDAGSPAVYLTQNISLRYTEEQQSRAPEARAPLSPEQAGAELGGIGIQVGSWNLENPEDELIVRTLPELAEGEEGWTLEAWDISLASGQHEFPGCVEITLPREEGEILGKIVWFNEETDCWEDVYAEVSEDGSAYTAWLDHFTKVAKLRYRYDAKKHALVELEKGESAVSVKNGVFVAIPTSKTGELEYKVAIDWTLLWNLYKTKKADEKTITAYSEKLTEVGKIETDPYKYITADISQLVESIFGAGANIDVLFNADTGLFFRDLSEAAVSGMGKKLWALDLALTMIKIEEDARKGGNFATMMKRLGPAAFRHWPELLGLVVGGIALALSSWYGALIGLLWFAGSSIYSAVSAISGPDLTGKNVTLEELYETYYAYVLRSYGSKGNRGVDYGGTGKRETDNDYCYVNMKDSQMKSVLPAKTFKKLQAALAPSKGGDWYPLGAEHNTHSDGTLDIWFTWTKAINCLVENCSDDPAIFSQALDALFYDYANAFWKLTDKQKTSYVSYVKKLNGYTDKDMEKNALKLLKDPIGDDRAKLTQALVNKLKTASRPVLVNVIKKYQAKLCADLQKEVEAQMLPVLNTQLVFHVEDPSLRYGQTFDDSIYSIDWRTIEANKDYAWQTAKFKDKLAYNDAEFITPMRFDGDPRPLFRPLFGENGVYDKEPWHHYYSSEPLYIPQPQEGTDVVFRCTYYHWLMMGEPKAIVFKDVRNADVKKYKEDPGIRGWIVLPEMNGQEKADIVVEIGGEEPVAYRGGDLVLQSYYWLSADMPMNSYSHHIPSYFRLALREAFRETPVRLNRDGSFEAAVSGSRTETFEFEGRRTEASIEYSLTLTGSFDRKTGTGKAGLMGNVSFRSGEVYEWAVFDGKACMVCTFNALPEHGVDYNKIAADPADVTYFSAVGDETVVIFFSAADETQPLNVSSGNTNAVPYMMFYFVLVPEK